MIELWLAKKWLPYAVAGAIAVVLLLLAIHVHNRIYDKGFAAAEAIQADAERALLLKRVELGRQVAEIDLTAVVVTATRREEIKRAVKKIVRTATPDDGAEQLRIFNEGVRSANTGLYSF